MSAAVSFSDQLLTGHASSRVHIINTYSMAMRAPLLSIRECGTVYLSRLISMILSLFNHFAALVSLMLSPLLVHLIPLWKSTIALSVMPHLVSGMNFPKNFANLSMMLPCDCHLIFLSPVHHHHHHHHFYYASLHLYSTPDSKLTFCINPSHIL